MTRRDARALSLSLMAADFVALGQRHAAVMIMLGLDEHRCVRFAQRAASRFDEHVPLHGGFALTATYTRMIRGFGGHPKFSKSIRGSAIDVTTPPDDVRRLLIEEPPAPERSATYQLMCQTPRYDGATMIDLYEHCREGGRSWRREVARFTDYLADLIDLWPR